MQRSRTVVALLIATALTIAALFPIFILPTPHDSNQIGSTDIALTPNKWQAEDPTISPNGQQIAFSMNASGTNQIWIMNSLDGSHLRELTTVAGSAIIPQFNSQGNIISFVLRHAGFSDLCFLHLFETNSQTSCATHDYHVGDHYSWSSSGNMVAYDNGTSIFLYNIETNQTQSFTYNGTAVEPVFGSSGTMIYFSGSIGSEYAIFEANLDGSNITRLSWTGFDVLPQLSKTGNELLYLTNYSGSWETWVMNVSTHYPANNLFLVPPQPNYFSQSPQILTGTLPRFSSNGSEVLVIQDLGNQSVSLVLASLSYHVFPLASGGLSFITPFSAITGVTSQCINDAVWSPTDGSIVYVSCTYQLHLLRLSPSNVVNVYG